MKARVSHSALSKKAAYAADQEDGVILICIRTNRVAAVIRAFIEKHPNSIVELDWKHEARPLDEWCTRRSLAHLIDLRIDLGGREILSLHDDRTELFAPVDQLPIVEELAARRVIRWYRAFEYDRRARSEMGGVGYILLLFLMVLRWC